MYLLVKVSDIWDPSHCRVMSEHSFKIRREGGVGGFEDCCDS